MGTDVASTRTAGRWLVLAGRIAGAGLTGWSAGIHLYLWYNGYRDIETVGPLFLVNAIGGFILAVAILVVPTRFLTIVSGLSALYAASVLGALILSLTVGLFGFFESTVAQLVTTTLVINSVAFLVLTAFTVIRVVRARREHAQ
jgi:hypothetical protein